MTRKLRVFGMTGVLGIVALVAPSPALATCAGPVSFGNNPVNAYPGACPPVIGRYPGSYYCYIYASGYPPAQTKRASMDGSFWSLGSGSPTNGVGSDNGTWDVDSDALGGWLTAYGNDTYPVYMTGGATWAADVGIDGCITSDPLPAGHSNPVMVVAFSDMNPGGHPVFAVRAVERVPANSPQFDFSFWLQNGSPGPGVGGSHIIMRPLLAMAVTGSSRDPGTGDCTIDLLCPDLSGLFSSDGTVNADEVIVGCRVYRTAPLTPTTGTDPVTRDRFDSGWIDTGTTIASGGLGSVTLGGASDSRYFLTFAVETDSGFQAQFLAPSTPNVDCVVECSTIDADGDGSNACIDCDDVASSVFPGASQVCDRLNNDCDDPTWPAVPQDEVDNDADSLAECEGDCDDTNGSVYPVAPQLCDGLNNDCNDPTWPAIHQDEVDNDADSLAECEGDCDDTNGSVYPVAPQLCDGLNNDCNDPTWPAIPQDEVDNDSDSLAECEGDCDDTNGSVYPVAPQLCDGFNNDCNDPNWPTVPQDEVDDDSDNFSQCEGDCDDTNGSVYPVAPQLCDGFNNDCNDPNWPTVPQDEVDDDSDNFSQCEGDCDDTNGSVYPVAPQLCDGLNNDCNDPGWPAAPSDEADGDSDTYRICENDCDDSNPTINPGAAEVCNAIDDDCNSLVDEDDLGEDTDADGFHNLCDNCREVYNPTQLDTDGDLVGNSCDNCSFVENPEQIDTDSDQEGNLCDNCPLDYNPGQEDWEPDGVGDACDNCTFDPNTSQSDVDGDFEGDICDFDDGVIYVFFVDPTFVEWQEELGFDSWNVYRGDLDVLLATGVYTQASGANPIARRECGLLNPWSDQPRHPPVGKAAFFLTTGMSGGVESDLGQDGQGNTRSNDNPCP